MATVPIPAAVPRRTPAPPTLLAELTGRLPSRHDVAETANLFLFAAGVLSLPLLGVLLLVGVL
ncbi:hypothetical protein L3Q67_01115 [Saccharothrix sp. AJ9571]|nr:hypothetical protein L3Q67_01115 [Saccharothrix sp. AJ9571]